MSLLIKKKKKKNKLCELPLYFAKKQQKLLYNKYKVLSIFLQMILVLKNSTLLKTRILCFLFKTGKRIYIMHIFCMMLRLHLYLDFVQFSICTLFRGQHSARILTNRGN